MSSMYFQLNRSLICNSEQKYIIFSPQTFMKQTIDVVNENVDVYCKVLIPPEIKLRFSEVSLKFKIKSPPKKISDLTVYVSST